MALKTNKHRQTNKQKARTIPMGEGKKKKAYKEEENWSLKFPAYLQGSNLHKALLHLLCSKSITFSWMHFVTDRPVPQVTKSLMSLFSKLLRNSSANCGSLNFLVWFPTVMIKVAGYGIPHLIFLSFFLFYFFYFFTLFKSNKRLYLAAVSLVPTAYIFILIIFKNSKVHSYSL